MDLSQSHHFVSHDFIANSGTALMLATFAHLVIGNTFIGILEGLLISKFLKTSRLKSVLIMIIANYVSAWIGTILAGYGMNSLDLTIESLKLTLTIVLLSSLILTLLLEYPFLTWITFGLPITTTWKIKTLITIHLISYSLMIFPWYLYFSHLSFLKLEVTNLDKIGNDPHRLAFLGPEKKELIIYDLSLQKIIETHPISLSDGSFAPWYLRTDPNFVHSRLLPPSFDSEDDRRMTRNLVRQLHQSETLQITLDSHFSWTNGLRIRDSQTGTEIYYKLETPFIDWSISSPTQLKDGLVIFELGRDQICLADFRQRKIALVARGSDPVILDQIPVTQKTSQ